MAARLVRTSASSSMTKIRKAYRPCVARDPRLLTKPADPVPKRRPIQLQEKCHGTGAKFAGRWPNPWPNREHNPGLPGGSARPPGEAPQPLKDGPAGPFPAPALARLDRRRRTRHLRGVLFALQAMGHIGRKPRSGGVFLISGGAVRQSPLQVVPAYGFTRVRFSAAAARPDTAFDAQDLRRCARSDCRAGCARLPYCRSWPDHLPVRFGCMSMNTFMPISAVPRRV